MGCVKNYIGKTSTLIKKGIYEHIKDFRIGDNRSALMKHNLETKQF